MPGLAAALLAHGLFGRSLRRSRPPSPRAPLRRPPLGLVRLARLSVASLRPRTAFLVCPHLEMQDSSSPIGPDDPTGTNGGHRPGTHDGSRRAGSPARVG